MPSIQEPVIPPIQGIRFSSGALAKMLEGELIGRPDVVLSTVSGIENAGPEALTFIRNAKFAQKWAASGAGAAVVTRGVQVPGHDPSARALIYVRDADMAMIRLLQIAADRLPQHVPATGVHPTAVVDPTAVIAPTARIGPLSVIGPGTIVGEHSVIHPRVVLGAMVRIGERCVLHPGVVVYDRCTVGSRTIIHANSTVGADGFGYRPDKSNGTLIKIPHIGDVVIGEDVEIGANSAVDRGKFGSTRIGNGTKIDNLCQIGHNCDIGKCVLICGVTGVAGSVTIGDGSIIAGHVGIADNLTLGPGVTIGAKSGVLDDVPAGEAWSGLPAYAHSRQMRTWAAAKKLPEFLPALKKLVQPKHAAERGGEHARSSSENTHGRTGA